MQTVAVVGVGLIGGSFALALRQAGFQGEILGVSSEGTIREAVALGVIERGVPLKEAAECADLLYLAQPIGEIIRTIAKLKGLVRPGTLVTDAGSTKVEILRQAGESLPDGSFLGGHPMAGKELRGVGAAEAGLFRNRTYFLTVSSPGEAPRHPVAIDLIGYVKAFGARPVLLEAAEHDRLVSLTSHLPQLASTAIASTLARILEPELARQGAGPGLIDMTRLAQSSYGLWADILSTNREAIDRALTLYIEELGRLRTSLRECNLEDTFQKAGSFTSVTRNQRP